MAEDGKRKRPNAVDDGRVLAPMDALDGHACPPGIPESPHPDRPSLSRYELWQALTGAMGASLLVVSVLSVTMILFVLFCTRVWLR